MKWNISSHVSFVVFHLLECRRLRLWPRDDETISGECANHQVSSWPVLHSNAQCTPAASSNFRANRVCKTSLSQIPALQQSWNPGTYTVAQTPQGTDVYLLQLSMNHRLWRMGQEFIHTSPLLPHHRFLGRGSEVQRGQEVSGVGELLVNGLAAQLLLYIHQQLPLSLFFLPLGDSYKKQVLITSLKVYS